jgi:hypothetical protein
MTLGAGFSKVDKMWVEKEVDIDGSLEHHYIFRLSVSGCVQC